MLGHPEFGGPVQGPAAGRKPAPALGGVLDLPLLPTLLMGRCPPLDVAQRLERPMGIRAMARGAGSGAPTHLPGSLRDSGFSPRKGKSR